MYERIFKKLFWLPLHLYTGLPAVGFSARLST